MAILAATKELTVTLSEPESLASDGTVTAGVSKPGIRIETWRVTGTLAAAAADEYIQTDLLLIKGVLGISVLGPTLIGTIDAWAVVLNGNGTGDTEGDVAGGLGIESTTGTSADLIVTVIGTFDGTS